MDWYSGLPVDLPVGLVEIDGLPVPAIDLFLQDSCRDDLLMLDGEPVAVRVVGPVEDAVARKPLSIEPCGLPVRLEAGEHHLETTPGRLTGIDIDRLVLRSGTAVSPVVSELLPHVAVLDWNRTSRDLEISAQGSPFWLVLGESFSEGWQLSSDDATVDPAPVLIDGFANGWLIDPAGHEGGLALHLEWTPQRLVRIGLAVSLLTALACLFLVRMGPRRRRRGRSTRTPRRSTWGRCP